MIQRTIHLLSSIVISIGLISCGYFISKGIGNLKQGARYVTVKGLAEREVAADFGVWPLTIKTSGNDLTTLNSIAQNNLDEITNFLLEQGFKSEEFALESYSVNDLLTSAYRTDNISNARYILQATILLRSSNVELIKKASALQYKLTQNGVVFSPENNDPSYILTKFNDLKPEMLSEAIKNARKAAEQFALDSEVKVGKIRTANQGSFVITAADGSVGDYPGSDTKSIQKKIRVVTTLEYMLE